ncbi:FAR1-related sequence 5-like protein, partial [Tanacetum coccineum]
KNFCIEAEIEELDDVTMNEDVEANVILEPVKINTPRPSLYLHNETPGGTTYWEPNVDEPYLPLEGKRFDTIEECVEFYSVYAEKGGFEVKKSAQKKTKSGMVRSKYVMCNREGVPKEININTLDPQNNDKQVRNTRYRITGCMARIKVDLDHVSREKLNNGLGATKAHKLVLQLKVELILHQDLRSENAFFKISQNHESRVVTFHDVLRSAMEKAMLEGRSVGLDKNVLIDTLDRRKKETVVQEKDKVSRLQAKLARTKAAAEQERRIAASATEQEDRNSDTAHIVDKEQSNTAS